MLARRSNVHPPSSGDLVIPGGFPDGAPATVRGIAKAQEIARSFFARNKPVAGSICHGPWLRSGTSAAHRVRGDREERDHACTATATPVAADS
jgi:putative intracellular protease/amidase